MRGFWAGVLAGSAIVAGVMVGAGRIGVPLHGMEAAEETAHYRILLENERVRVREAVFPAGVLDTGMHTHQYAHVGVILTKGTLLFRSPDGKTDSVSYEPGTVGFREANATHAVGNPGTEAMRVIEVEIK